MEKPFLMDKSSCSWKKIGRSPAPSPLLVDHLPSSCADLTFVNGFGTKFDFVCMSFVMKGGRRSFVGHGRLIGLIQ